VIDYSPDLFHEFRRGLVTARLATMVAPNLRGVNHHPLLKLGSKSTCVINLTIFP